MRGRSEPSTCLACRYDNLRGEVVCRRLGPLRQVEEMGRDSLGRHRLMLPSDSMSEARAGCFLEGRSDEQD